MIIQLIFCFVVLVGAETAAYSQTIEILEPKVPEGASWPNTLDLTFKVSDDIKQVRVLVKTPTDVSKKNIDIDSTKREQSTTLGLLKGLNEIQLLGFKAGETDPSASASMKLNCVGKKCGSTGPTTEAGTGGIGGGETGEAGQAKGAGTVLIVAPAGPKATNSLIKSTILVKKSDIETLLLQVTNAGKQVAQSKTRLPVRYTDDVAILKPDISLKKGNNVILLRDLDDPDNKQTQATITINCDDDKCDTPAIAGPDLIRINIPEYDTKLQDAGYVHSKITVKKDSKIDRVFVRVLNNGKPLDNPLEKTVAADRESIPISFGDKTEVELTPNIRVGPGTNFITVFDAARGLDAGLQDSTEVTCAGENCGGTDLITIVKPDAGSEVDSAFIDSYLSIAKESAIQHLKYEIVNGDKRIVPSEKFEVKYLGDSPASLPVRLKILEGENTIRFFDADDPSKLAHQATLRVNCKGVHCVNDFDIAKYPGSQNSRAVVGMEQAGASSASSQTKPFLDFFFTTPLILKCGRRSAPTAANPRGDCDEQEALARVGAWGDIRLASTPDQISAASIFPSNFVNELGKSSNTVDLVQSFDFLAGLEFRLWSGNGPFLSLIPTAHQRTHIYLAGGVGAISPLAAKRETAQIFKIPISNDPQFADFIDRYGTPPTTTPAKEFIGLVPLDRDRFLRQWYLGLRLKTLYCDNDFCTKYKNNFPAIVDFMVGQNEAVTGGSLKYTSVDPNDKTKIIEKNAFVLRVDAFYPFPIKEGNFLYFYGTALMKIGGGGVRVQNPLFLDRAAGDVLITDPKVYIPTTDRQKLFQPNRDYYKIGIGINLTELFNRNKTSQ